MAPKRKRSLKSLDEVPLLELKEEDSTMQTSMPEMLKLPSPFEFEDDWWSRPTASSDVLGPHGEQVYHDAAMVYDDAAMVEPLLHFPDEMLESETSNILNLGMGLSATPASAVPHLNSSAAAPSNKKKRTGTASAAAAATRKKALGIDPQGKAISPRESHILSERQRRKGMNHLFSTLASLLPDSFSKSDKSTIVSEIIVYIQSLRKDLDELNKKRSEALNMTKLPSQPSSSTTTSVQQVKNVLVPKDEKTEMRSTQAPNVVLTICGNDVFITISSNKETPKNFFSKVLVLIKKHNLVFVDANISSNSNANFHYFHVKAEISQHLPKNDSLQKQLQSLVTVEGIGPCSLAVSAL